MSHAPDQPTTISERDRKRLSAFTRIEQFLHSVGLVNNTDAIDPDFIVELLQAFVVADAKQLESLVNVLRAQHLVDGMRHNFKPQPTIRMAKNLVFNSPIQAQQAAANAAMPISKERIAAMFGIPTDMLSDDSSGGRKSNAGKDVNVEGDKDSECAA